MTRSDRERDVVSLSVSNWLAIAALFVTTFGAAWKFTLDISGRLQAVETKVQGIERQLAK
jgi:predicted component of type VI protein secretion system